MADDCNEVQKLEDLSSLEDEQEVGDDDDIVTAHH